MTICFVNHYAGGGDRPVTGTYDTGRELVRRGHRVIIFASSFSHYKFREEKLLKGEAWKEEIHEGVRIIWVRSPSYRGNTVRRLINMLGFSWNVFRFGPRLCGKPDVVMGTCPHTFAVLAAWLLAWRKKAKFFFEVRDLWPQMFVDLGTFSDRNPLIWIWRALEKFLYRKAARIITVAPGMGLYVSSLGIAPERVTYIPNGVDLNRYAEVRAYDGGLSQPFPVVYLGGHARYNGVNVIIEAAEILQRTGNNHVKFLLVGDGPEKPSLVHRALEMGLKNVEFRPLIPKTEIGTVLSEASAFIAHIIDIPMLRYVGTSTNKLLDYMAAGRPVIFAINAPNNAVAEAQAGLTIPPDNAQAMAQAIEDLVALTPEQRLAMGKNARRYVEQHYDIRVLAGRLETACLAARDGQTPDCASASRKQTVVN